MSRQASNPFKGNSTIIEQAEKRKLILSRVNKLVDDKRDILTPQLNGKASYRSQ